MISTEKLHDDYLKGMGFSPKEVNTLNLKRKDYIRRIYIEPIKTLINEGLGVTLTIGLPRVADYIDANYPLDGHAQIATNILRFTAQITPYLMAGEGLRLVYNEVVGWKSRRSYNKTIQEKWKSNAK